MDLSKITLSLYDIFGYLLPGYLIFVAASIAEASFTQTNILFLGRANKNMIVTALLAYFLGVVSHSIAALIHRRRFRGIAKREQTRAATEGGSSMADKPKTPAGMLDPVVRDRVVTELETAYRVELDTVPGLDRYLLADSYVLASGGSPEREMLTSREGFFKAGTIAMVVLAVTLLVVTIFTVPQIQTVAAVFFSLGKVVGAIAFLLVVVLAIIFHLQFKFFNEAKRTNAFLVFLAIRSRPAPGPPK